MATITQIKADNASKIGNKTLPSSISPSDVASQLDAEADEIRDRGMTQAANTGALAAISKENTRAVTVPGVGLFTALQTVSAPDGVTTFASADSGWLWFLAIKYTTQLPISQLLGATAINTISNANLAQTWNWVLTAGGFGLNIVNNRNGTVGTTAETLLRLEIAGNDQSPRAVKNLQIVNTTRIPPNKTSGSVTALDIVMNGTAGGTGLPNVNWAQKINSTFSGLDIVAADRGLTVQGNIIAISANGPSLIRSQFGGVPLIVTIDTVNTAGIKFSSVSPILPAIHLDHLSPSVAWFQSVDANARKAIISIGAGTIDRASMNIEAGVAPTNPVDGDIWRTDEHLYARLDGVTYQLDQQPLGENDESLYSVDGVLPEPRTVDQAGFPLTFDNVGLFRIRNIEGGNSHIYDFNEGVDFLCSETGVQSYSILMDIVNGIRFRSVTTAGSVTREIVVDGSQVKVDSTVLKLVNLPVFANDGAASSLAADTVYKTATGELRIKL